MGVSIVDGAVETATIKRTRGKFTIFSPLTFRLADGGSRTIKNAIVSDSVTHLLKPGANGRFYLSNTIDVKGVHGARTDQGTAYDFPGQNNAKAFMLVIAMSLALIVLRLIMDDGLTLLGVGLFILGTVGLVLTKRTQAEAKAQFDADQQ